MKTLSTYAARLGTFIAFGVVAVSANADLITITNVEAQLDGPNDCAGDFTITTGDDCAIFGPLDGTSGTDADADNIISPIMGKWDTDEGDWDLINTDDFPSLTGDEWGTDPSFDSNTSFTYTQGDGDPGLRYWIAKRGGGRTGIDWILYFYSDHAACTDVKTSFDCINSALTVNSGTYDNTSLSHISFYDTGSTKVAEPGTLALLGMGLLGLAVARRRKI